MNTETGQLYVGVDAIAEAQARGEPLTMISPAVAQVVRAGHRALAKAKQKRKRKQSRADRKRNRAR